MTIRSVDGFGGEDKVVGDGHLKAIAQGFQAGCDCSCLVNFYNLQLYFYIIYY